MTMMRSAADMISSTEQFVEAGRRVIDMARTLVRGTAPSSPLNATVSRNRRFTVAKHELEEYRQLRTRFDCDVNDVVLSVVTGALRNWLMSRGQSVSTGLTVRAMAPMSVYPETDHLETAGPGQAISEGTTLHSRLRTRVRSSSPGSAMAKPQCSAHTKLRITAP